MKSPGSSFLDDLRRAGWIRPEAQLVPLSGGVSSEIFLVEDGDERFVLKRALPKLKVRDDWFADVNRNVSEWRFIEEVSRFMPEAVPRLRFKDTSLGCFGMEYLGDAFSNWKALLLNGKARPEHARMAGEILGQIHKRTAGADELRRQFDTTANFHQLRTSPYLLTTADRHPELKELFLTEARRLEATRECLVHGDFSPKNILISESRMVLLDCEVAWYGDPSFDLAFLLNHFFLKVLFHARHDFPFESLVNSFWQSYTKAHPSAGGDLEPRVARLLPMLMLARVDGKSPVEYLDDQKRARVRSFAREMLHSGPAQIVVLAARWSIEVQSRKRNPVHHEN